MNIEFYPTSDEVERLVPAPKPAKQHIPEWYKESLSFKTSNKLTFDDNYRPDKTVKLCIPVLDALTMGYVQTSWTDVYIKQIGEDFSYAFASGPKIMESRDRESIQKMPVPEGYYETPFHWLRPWVAKVPPGYSILLTHPLYREDLPFRCVTGVIDSDEYLESGKMTFFVKKGFDGVIPYGTPLFQIIPIKRDHWKSSIKPLSEWTTLVKNKPNVLRQFVGGYKNLYWNKKTYE